jgi:hypothetical protein
VQGYDRYAYVSNNPVRYTDPSGHGPSCDDGDWEGCNPPQVNCKRGSDHYCKTGNGANIDTTHFSQEVASEFWKSLLRAWRTGATTITTPSIVVGKKNVVGNWDLVGSFSATYTVDFSNVQNEDQLAQIGAGMWWDFQQRFEEWEGTIAPGAAGHTTFQNEDIPSTFLAYVATVKGMSFRDVMVEMGGALPSSHTGGGARNSTISCLTGGFCDNHTSRNNTIYFKVQGDDGTWNLMPYPESLNITPIQDSQYFTYSSCTTAGLGADC